MSEVKKILFVDDDETIISGIKLTVGRKFEIRTSTSVTEALEIFKRDGPFAVVVSDFQMPVMNGADFLQKIRESDLEVVTMLLTERRISKKFRCGSGRIFRLLGKPHQGKDGGASGCRFGQYRMIRAEKDLLEQQRGFSRVVGHSAASKPLFSALKGQEYGIRSGPKIGDQ